MTPNGEDHVGVLVALRDAKHWAGGDGFVPSLTEQQRAALDYAIKAVEAAESRADTVDDVLHSLEGWGKAYPVDIFPEPTKEQRDWLHGTRPGLMDRIGASMGRHIANCIAADVAKLRKALAPPQADTTGGRS